MDKIEKALGKSNVKDRKRIKDILTRLNLGNLDGLDIKKLRDRIDIFRIRKGDFRIIYRLNGRDIFILAIERRCKDTYKF